MHAILLVRNLILEKRTSPKFCFLECGLRPYESQLNSSRIVKIIGGKNAEYGMFPWQVGIRKVINETGTTKITKHHCGGIIISPVWILSAAHCFSGGR
jgi:secreted trypsin-like serine protease